MDIFCRGFRQCGGDFEVKKYDILPSVGAGSLLTISQAKNTGEIGKNFRSADQRIMRPEKAGVSQNDLFGDPCKCR